MKSKIHEYRLNTAFMSKKIVLLFVLISSYAFSQSVTDYQYVIVPVKFDFLKKEDQYRLNTLTKLLLQKYGFKTYLSTEEIPSNIDNQRCNFLYAEVLENNGIILTKLKIVLKDCGGKVLYETEFGGSREKEYAAAYNEALREAGKSFNKLNYKYQPSDKSLEKIGEQAKVIEAKSEATNLKKSVETIDANTSYQETTAEMIAKRLKIVKTDGGFELYDVSNVLVLTARKTSVANVFMAKAGDENGILQRREDFNWYFDYYRIGSTKLISERLYFDF